MKNLLLITLICLTAPAFAQDTDSKNGAAWKLFDNSDKPEDLKQAELLAVEAINSEPENGYFIDTYANILYKMGRTSEAIEWQTKALWIVKLDPSFAMRLFKMKAGLPTWKFPKQDPKPVDQKVYDRIWAEMKKELYETVDDALSQSKAMMK